MPRPTPWHRILVERVPPPMVALRAIRLNADLILQPGNSYPAPETNFAYTHMRDLYERGWIGVAAEVERAVIEPASDVDGLPADLIGNAPLVDATAAFDVQMDGVEVEMAVVEPASDVDGLPADLTGNAPAPKKKGKR